VCTLIKADHLAVKQTITLFFTMSNVKWSLLATEGIDRVLGLRLERTTLRDGLTDGISMHEVTATGLLDSAVVLQHCHPLITEADANRLILCRFVPQADLIGALGTDLEPNSSNVIRILETGADNIEESVFPCLVKRTVRTRRFLEINNPFTTILVICILPLRLDILAEENDVSLDAEGDFRGLLQVVVHGPEILNGIEIVDSGVLGVLALAFSLNIAKAPKSPLVRKKVLHKDVGVCGVTRDTGGRINLSKSSHDRSMRKWNRSKMRSQI